MVLLYLTNGRLTDEGLQYTINHKGLNQKTRKVFENVVTQFIGQSLINQ
jgi:hypothetical protein